MYKIYINVKIKAIYSGVTTKFSGGVQKNEKFVFILKNVHIT